MKDLLSYLLKNVVDQQEEVKIEETIGEDGITVFKVTVHPDDVGKVIGKKGKIINSIRNLVRVKAIKLQQRARVEVVNPPLQAPTQPMAPAANAPTDMPAATPQEMPAETETVTPPQAITPTEPTEPVVVKPAEETQEPKEEAAAQPETQPEPAKETVVKEEKPKKA